MARHPSVPYRPAWRSGALRDRAARRLAPLLLLALLVPAACDSPIGSPVPDPAGADADTGADGAAALGDAVPGCPFTADRVSELLGQPLIDEGNCVFGDGKGVASLTVTTASQFAGAATYTYQREQAGQQYERVVDLDRGDQSYLAAKDIAGEAVVVSAKGSYTMIMSSFGLDVAGYEQRLRRLLDALPA